MYVKWNMSGHCRSEVEAQQDRGYTLRGRRIEYVSPELSRRSGDRTRDTIRVLGGSATEKDDRGCVDVVPEQGSQRALLVLMISSGTNSIPGLQ